MEAWCDGVQRLTQEYFSSLGKLLVAHLDLRAPSKGGWRNTGGGGAAEKGAITSRQRSERTLHSDLDVQVADIEAMEMALLQKLWAHQHQRYRSVVVADGRTERKDRSGGASRAGACAAAAAAEDAPLNAACSTEGNSFPKTQPPSTSESDTHVPEELLELFRTAQALRSAASRRTGPPSRATASKEAAAEGKSALEASADRPSRAPVVLSEEEMEEAAAMALQCFRFFYSSYSTPAPAAAATDPLASDTPLPGQPPQTSHVHQRRVAATAAPEQRRQYYSPSFSIPNLTHSTKPPRTSNSADALSPTSLSSPAAWRRLIVESGTVDGTQHHQQQKQQLPSPSLQACAADHLTAEFTAPSPQQTQGVPGSYSFDFPTQRGFFTSTGTSVDADAAAERAKLVNNSSDNLITVDRHTNRRDNRAREAASRPPLAHPTGRSHSTKNASHRGTAGNKGAVKLPLLNPHASPASADERAPSRSASPPLPSPTTTTPPVAAAGGTPHVTAQHPALPALATGTPAALSSNAAATVPNAPAAAPLRIHGNGANKEQNRYGSGQRRRAPRRLPTDVVLPPNYSGAHGELLTVAQLEELLGSVSQDGAMAQAEMKRQYDAADAAAEELYRLQQAVARVLVENIQLENDILTLTATSHACAAGGEGGGAGDANRNVDAIAEVRGRHHNDGIYSCGNRHSGTSKTGSCAGSMAHFSTWALSPACTADLFPEKPKRQIILPPAPVPLPRAKSTLTAASLLLHATPAKKAAPSALAEAASAAQPRPWRHESAPAESTKQYQRRPKVKTRAGASASAAAVEGGAAAAAHGQQDPHTILQELRTAIARCEAERTQLLAEIDALSSRVTRHDSLLHAVAEYWRRNAAVMKRQHFAVQSHPKQSTTSGNINRLGDGDGWVSENALDAITSPYLFAASDDAGDTYTQTSSSDGAHSASSRKLCHSIVATATTSQSGNMTNLGGSPSQLQRALAQMEAISPAPLSSSPSFDMHITPSAAGALSPSLPKRFLVRRRAQEGESAVKKSDDMPAALHGATAALIETESTPVRVRVGVRVTPGTEEEHSGRPHRKVVAPSREDPATAAAATSSTLTDTNTNTTATTFLGSPDTVSNATGRQLSASAAVVVETPEALKQERCNSTHAHAVSAVAVTLFSDSHRSSPGHLLASSPGFTQARDGGAREEDDIFDDRSLPTTPLHPSCSTTANQSRNHPSGGMRHEDEAVLGRGSWRTIPALQLENVDEIAEFIYSVFERS
ncbi:hypothetical protein LSCM4_08099 [Leishmania orientalis]|uniref:Uncharacterized protein n=1 Tax=Leishmania orientalis TaxID=2249476 RepID=A0A836KUH7_9TRYP|nr:hypothetical protein LSCM4_08099 [Leishmania orientalis]